MTSVLIIGAGKIGTALSGILRANTDLTISVWDKDLSKNSHDHSLSDLGGGAHILFLCIPSWAHREALVEIRSYLQNDAIVISVSKGIEEKSLKTIDEVLLELLPDHHVYGPMLADELLAGDYGAAVLASGGRAVFDRIAPLFVESSKFLLRYSNDIHGVALCGVLKNIYAILLGAADGLDLGCNVRGILMTQIFLEMSVILQRLGGLPETVNTFAGIGDFIATSSSSRSNNFSFGKEFALRGDCEKSPEGCVSLSPLLALLQDADSLPLLRAVTDILIHKKPVHEIINQFFINQSESIVHA
jgi:glycerol-3-phosphate dehydrogenase (NAD(P)+)